MIPFCPAARAVSPESSRFSPTSSIQLDGAEQAAIAGVLTTTATETGAAEQYARELIRRAK